MFILLAQAADEVNLDSIKNPATNIPTTSTLGDILTKGGFNLFTIVFFLVGFLFFIRLSLAAFNYVFSEGNADKLAKANTQIVQSIIGIVVVLASFVIVNLVLTLFGLESISPF